MIKIRLQQLILVKLNPVEHGNTECPDYQGVPSRSAYACTS